MSALLRKNLEPIREFLDNLSYKEIFIERPYRVVVETKKGQKLFFDRKELSLVYLKGMVKILASASGKKLNDNNPVISLAIDDKHRAQVVYGSRTNNGISITIRLKRNSGITLDNFDFTPKLKEQLINLVKQKKTFLISGGTGTGKTTLLNALIDYIPLNQRIITIENVREIEVDTQKREDYCALTSLEDADHEIALLVNSSLRMNPVRLILGELRLENSYHFLKACNSGHEGTISTVHSNSPQDAISAIVHNIKAATKGSVNEEMLKAELRKYINCVVQLESHYDEEGKRIVSGYLEEM